MQSTKNNFLLGLRGYCQISVFAYNNSMGGMWSVKEAAEKLSLSEQHLRLLLKKGEVKGKKLGGTWVVLDLNYTRKRKPKGGKK